MRKFPLFFIRLYQSLPLAETHASCRYFPTCSDYAYESIAKYGILKGSFLGLKRVLRCSPFHLGGPDPVP